MPRTKILDVNEGVGETLFYPYNVLVNKCSVSCDTINDPMARLCVPNIIKRTNMKVYNFLMRLNETRNVLWHESCKCVCKLNSSVCNNKQIWNSDTCRCDCNEDFAGIMTCNKGYMWNPSTCECQCDALREYIEDKIILDKIDGFDKIRFSSDIDLSLGTLIQFEILTIIIRCIIKKDDKNYPKIYLDECLYDKV